MRITVISYVYSLGTFEQTVEGPTGDFNRNDARVMSLQIMRMQSNIYISLHDSYNKNMCVFMH